jgi:hypothetical protein
MQLSAYAHGFDLGTGGTGGCQNVRCLCTVSYVIQLKIHWAEVQLCLIHAR